jgi:hypothetical protein
MERHVFDMIQPDAVHCKLHPYAYAAGYRSNGIRWRPRQRAFHGQRGISCTGRGGFDSTTHDLILHPDCNRLSNSRTHVPATRRFLYGLRTVTYGAARPRRQACSTSEAGRKAFLARSGSNMQTCRYFPGIFVLSASGFIERWKPATPTNSNLSTRIVLLQHPRT